LNAKEYLLQIKKLDKMIQNKQIEIQQYKDVALSITPTMSGERVQSTSNPQKIADAIDSYLDIEAEVKRDLADLMSKKREIIATIEQLNTVEYDILHKMYVQYLTFDEIAYACGYSRSWVTTVHGRALQHVQDLISKRKGE
jgi:DNA-directed RNA polymerase specialized sigma subunit